MQPRLGLSDLREHNFKHIFEDSSNSLCKCHHNIESATHYLLHCTLFVNERNTFFATLRTLDCNLLDYTDFTQTLLFDNASLTKTEKQLN